MTGLAGRWRLVEMDNWDRNAIDLVGPGFIEFARKRAGEFGFIAVRGWLDCRWSKRDGRPFVEFSREGSDEGDQVNGRGWAVLTEDGELTGQFLAVDRPLDEQAQAAVRALSTRARITRSRSGPRVST